MSYILLSLPESNSDNESNLNFFENNLNLNSKNINKINLPIFKIGTLDSLILQSEELSKLDNQLNLSIIKSLEILNSLLGESNNKNINLKIDNQLKSSYLEKFQWKNSIYRIEKSIDELINLISNNSIQLDNDLRNSYSNYINIKNNLINLKRKQNGDLSIKSLHEIVKKDNFIQNSDYLKTILLAIPNSIENEFLNNYETISKFVVPRSANLISKDNEFSLYSVIIFKKFENEFLHASRENKWIPRDFIYNDLTINKLKDEFNNLLIDENNLKNDILRLSREAYSIISIDYYHIKFLRSFVESVLRYGLPPNFNYYLIKIENNKNLDLIYNQCIKKFSYLAGNAFSIDNNGNLLNDSKLNDYSNIVDTNYEPFVIYKIDLL